MHGLNFYEYKTYTQKFNQKINLIVSKINEKYPDVNKTDLVEILNNTTSENNYLLREYGIDLEKDSLILENDNYFLKFIILNISLIIILSILLLLIFFKYNNLKDKELQKITKYIEEINNRNYKLDIDENTEDELSILKNEIYKITVMLKETAENSMQDKINLKDSLSNISHQLKTPLTSITIMLDNILENPNMENSIKNGFIKDIKRQILNINFLVVSLLKLSKFDACSVHFVNKEEYIENILKNCVEYSYENSKIDIYYEENKMYSKIEIKDYGTGIDKEDIQHIFERFYKGKHSSNESIGIGLALSKSIIEKDNGHIIVESEINKGTTFTIKYFY